MFELDFRAGVVAVRSCGLELSQQPSALCIELRQPCSGLSSNGRRRLFMLAERRCRALKRTLEVFDQDEKLTVLLERGSDLRPQRSCSAREASSSASAVESSSSAVDASSSASSDVSSSCFASRFASAFAASRSASIWPRSAAASDSAARIRAVSCSASAELREFLQQFSTVRCRLRFQRAERGVGACGPLLELLDSRPRGAEICQQVLPLSA